MTTFITELDNFGNPFFSLDLQGNSDHLNVSEISMAQGGNVGHFFDDSMQVSGRFAGPFSSDRTERDDVLLAFFSLILLLVIEAIVTTILLRKKHGSVYIFGFSIKQVVEVIKDFKLQLFVLRTKKQQRRRPINIKLISIAVSILFMTLGLEIAILFLTSPEWSDVTNNMATLRIIQPVTPLWNSVRFHSRASINRPCVSFTLVGVEQGKTRINMCVTSTISREEFDLFSEASGEVSMELISYMHEYGAEHSLRVDNLTATYSTRAYFTLNDKKSRLMGHISKSEKEKEQMNILHSQFIAYLFTAYKRATKDESMNLKRLEDLRPSFDSCIGPDIMVLQLPSKTVRVKSTKYNTIVTGIVPRGIPALRLAQQFFRGSAAIIVAGPSEKDLFVEEGMASRRSVVWRERTRALNWLSLGIVVVGAVLLLAVLRFSLHPVSIAEIAGAFVKKSVGADLHRSPVHLEDRELAFFRIQAAGDDDEYVFGAEGCTSRISDEYTGSETILRGRALSSAQVDVK